LRDISNFCTVKFTVTIENAIFFQFYLGHFPQQLAFQAKWQQGRGHMQEKGLYQYEMYLELAEDTAESRFYAQWQAALLQDERNYPWPQTEKSLMKADIFDSLRGEPLKKFIEHYCHTGACKKARELNNLNIKEFLHKNPTAIRHWFVDFEAYDWHLIENHRYFCSIGS
jgi:hypothetical protein